MAETIVGIIAYIGLACVALVIIVCLIAIGWFFLNFLWEVFINGD